MLSVALLGRCQPLRVAPSKLLGNRAQSRVIARELITPAKHSNNGFGLNIKRLKITSLIKSNGIIARLCSSAPKQKPPKAVGYWLLGCSGMVFAAVVLGMAGGYVVLLYSIYYVVHVILSTTNGSK